MAEDQEYSALAILGQSPSELESGEVFIRFRHWKIFRRLLQKYITNNQELEITFKPYRYKRSLAQNRYMWGYLVPTIKAWIKETTGERYTKDEVYVYLNSSVLGNKPHVKLLFNEEIIVMTGKRFSQMTTKEFCEAVETIAEYFAERGCVIQMPKEDSNNVIDDFVQDI